MAKNLLAQDFRDMSARGVESREILDRIMSR
jgi:hypothetical protein